MDNPDMCANFFNYRVEFQMRGAAHVHGVLWMDMPELEKAFPGNRQMGEAEVFYRMLPHLCLSDSNIKCKFLAGGFPWDRTKLLRPVDEDKLLQGEDEDDFLME